MAGRMAKGAAAKDIDGYLAAVPPDARAALERLRKQIRTAAPGVEEGIAYQMPGFKYRGRPLAYFAAFADHCSFFTASAEVIEAHQAELKNYDTAKGTIRFSASKPLPATLVRKIVTSRIAEIEAAEAQRLAKRRKGRQEPHS
jgi:uncharacterized protein YdhG (YjbR/CyaY superfamily)